MADLPTLELGTYTDVNLTTIVGSDPVLEAIASADDADYLQAGLTNSTHTAVAQFTLANMPTDFDVIETLSVQLRYAWETGTQVNSWNSLTAQVFESDGTTALTDAATLATDITTTDPTNSSVIEFTGVNTTAGKSVWDDAVVRISIDITKSMAGDTLGKRVFAAELTRYIYC